MGSFPEVSGRWPPVLCLLALEIWAGRGPWSAKVRAGQVPGERSERLWGAAPSLWARSAAEAVALRGADRRPQSEGQKGKIRRVGGPQGANQLQRRQALPLWICTAPVAWVDVVVRVRWSMR